MSFVFKCEHAFSLIGEFFLTNIYFPKTYINPYNDIIRTHEKIQITSFFLWLHVSDVMISAFALARHTNYFMAIHDSVE